MPPRRTSSSTAILERIDPESEAKAAVWALTREIVSLFSSFPRVPMGGQVVPREDAGAGWTTW